MTKKRYILVLIGLGLSLTTATQLRLAGPIGVGEVLLAIATLQLVARAGLESPTPPGGNQGVAISLLAVAAIGTACMGIGAWISALQGFYSNVDWRTAALIIGSICFSLLLLRATPEPRDFSVILITIAASFAFQFIVLGGFEFFLGDIPYVDLWYEGDVRRFTALASNPNQLALALVPLPFLIVQGTREVPSSMRGLGIALGIVAVAAGLMTASDALAVAWLVGSISLGWLALVSALRTARGARLAFIAVLVALLLAAIVVLCLPRSTELVDLVVQRLNEGDQARTRVMLWLHGLWAWGTSPLFGLGPGAYSGYDQGFDLTEAHSTPIDWLTMAGLLGLAPLVWFCVYVIAICVRRSAPLCISACVALLAFALFHNVLRQPLFWFYFVSAPVLAGGAVRDRVAKAIAPETTMGASASSTDVEVHSCR